MDKQHGFSMFIALIVLVPMMLAAVALTRSVDTAGLIMGNIVLKQSAIYALDCGVEDAIKNLEFNFCNLGSLSYYKPFISPTTGNPSRQVASCNPNTEVENTTVEYTISRLCSAPGLCTSDTTTTNDSRYIDGSGASCEGIGGGKSKRYFYKINVYVSSLNERDGHVSNAEVITSIVGPRDN